MDHKKCNKCGLVKPVDHFDFKRDSRYKNNSSYRYQECKDCRKHTRRLEKYGLTADQYHFLLEKQNHCCFICGISTDHAKLVIDHCHDSGVVRGLLCHHCNTGIGMLKDSPEILANAIQYLLPHK